VIEMMKFWVIGSVFVIYFYVKIQVKYNNIAATKKVLKEFGLAHNETYDAMSPCRGCFLFTLGLNRQIKEITLQIRL
jgi:hypothetical protein